MPTASNRAPSGHPRGCHSLSPIPSASALILMLLLSSSRMLAQSAPSVQTSPQYNASGWQDVIPFTFSDPNGGGDIIAIQMDLGNSVNNSCVVYLGRGPEYGIYNPNDAAMWLANDANTSWGALQMVGRPDAGPLQNSACVVEPRYSSVQITGTLLTVNLAVTFKSAYIGQRTLWALAEDSLHLNSGGFVPTGAFTVTLATPSISGVSPTSGLPGSSVTISGTGFGARQATGSVRFNGAIATVTQWTASTITAQVPSQATSGSILLTVDEQARSWSSFTVTAPPVAPSITSLSPNSGIVNSAVTIGGTAFGSTQGTVYFGTAAATVISWTNTAIQVSVPSLPPGNTSIVVTASGLPSTAAAFTVYDSAPSISLATPRDQTGPHPNPKLKFTFSDPNGGRDIQWVQMAIGETLANSCVIFIWVTPNVTDSAINLMSDSYNPANPDWGVQKYLGVSDSYGPLHNGQCQINYAASTAQIVGTNLEVDLDVTFYSAYAGQHTIYSMAHDITGLESGSFQYAGTWTVAPTYTINGVVTASGMGLGGVSVALAGSQIPPTTTDASGRYSFSDVPGGTGYSYTVTPSKANSQFTPTSAAIATLTSNYSVPAFAAVPPVVTTTAFSGTVGIPFSRSMAASDASAPFTWTFLSGTLPQGLSWSNGVISGTPTVSSNAAGGPATFNVSVRGADGASSASTPVSITISPDFGITIPNSDQAVQSTGQVAFYTVTLLPQPGFQGPVTLSAVANPSLPGQYMSISSASLPVGAAWSTTLLVSPPSSTPAS